MLKIVNIRPRSKLLGNSQMNYQKPAYRNILIVDDDQRLVEGLGDFLRPNGFKVHSCRFYEELPETIKTVQPVALLLDIMLPGEKDGFDLLRELRADSNLPVIMITARGDETDRIVGLEMGADDYLPKPFNPRELLARLRAVLRRCGQSSARPAAKKNAARKIFSGDFSLDLQNFTIGCQDKNIRLSNTAGNILKVFMEHAGETLSREKLIKMALGAGYNTVDRVIDVHISHLRSILRDINPEAEPIRTVWRAGYRWVAGND